MINRVANVSKVSLVRPSNTAAYTANDIIGVADAAVPANAGSAVLTFPKVGTGAIVIDEVWLRIDLNAVPANMGAFVLHLYDEAPTACLDNATAASAVLLAADRDKYLDAVAITIPVDMGDTLWVAVKPAKRVLLKSASLYGILQTVGNYTPSSGEVLTVKLICRQADVG